MELVTVLSGAIQTAGRVGVDGDAQASSLFIDLSKCYLYAHSK